jgi:hypothetical protein
VVWFFFHLKGQLCFHILPAFRLLQAASAVCPFCDYFSLVVHFAVYF